MRIFIIIIIFICTLRCIQTNDTNKRIFYELLLKYYSTSCDGILNKNYTKEILFENLNRILQDHDKIEKFKNDFNEYMSGKPFEPLSNTEKVLEPFKKDLSNRRWCDNRSRIILDKNKYIISKLKYKFFDENENFKTLILLCVIRKEVDKYSDSILEPKEIKTIGKIINVYKLLEQTEHSEFINRSRTEQVNTIMRKMLEDPQNIIIQNDLILGESNIWNFINETLNKNNTIEINKIRNAFDTYLFNILQSDNFTSLTNCFESALPKLIISKIRKLINVPIKSEHIISVPIAKNIFFDDECNHVIWNESEYDTDEKIEHTVANLTDIYTDPLSYRLQLRIYLYKSIQERNRYPNILNINDKQDEIIASFCYSSEDYLDEEDRNSKILDMFFMNFPEMGEFNSGVVASKLQIKCLINKYKDTLNKRISKDFHKVMHQDCDYFLMIGTNTMHSLLPGILDINNPNYSRETKVLVDKIQSYFKSIVHNTELNLFVNSSIGFFNNLINAVGQKCIIDDDINQYFNQIFERLNIYSSYPIRQWRSMCYLYEWMYNYKQFYSLLTTSATSQDINLFFCIYLKYQTFDKDVSKLKTSENKEILDLLNNIKYKRYVEEFLNCVETLDFSFEDNLLTQLGLDMLESYIYESSICKSYLDADSLNRHLKIRFEANESFSKYDFKIISSLSKLVESIYNITSVTECHFDKIKLDESDHDKCQFNHEYLSLKYQLTPYLNFDSALILEVHHLKCKCILENLKSTDMLVIYDDKQFWDYIDSFCNSPDYLIIYFQYCADSSPCKDRSEDLYELMSRYYILNISDNPITLYRIKCNIRRILYYAYNNFSNINASEDNTYQRVYRCLHEKIEINIDGDEDPVSIISTVSTISTISTISTKNYSTLSIANYSTLSSEFISKQSIYPSNISSVETTKQTPKPVDDIKSNNKVLFIVLGVVGALVLIGAVIGFYFLFKYLGKDGSWKKTRYLTY